MVVSDMAGAQLITTDADAEWSITLDVAKLQPGPYVCRVTFVDGTNGSIILIRDV